MTEHPGDEDVARLRCSSTRVVAPCCEPGEIGLSERSKVIAALTSGLTATTNELFYEYFQLICFDSFSCDVSFIHWLPFTAQN